jgi:hypothetical protein
MRRLTIAIGLALLLPSAAHAQEAPPSQCIACHEREAMPISLGHAFLEWRYSAHGRTGCEKCHGGDPQATTAEAAHRGVLPAAEPESLVHPTRLATTCGACHEPEVKAYQGTVHAREVAEKGRGATCITCHGAMAASLPSPMELETRCSSCHADPHEAKNALIMLAASRKRLTRTRTDVDALREKDPAWHRNALERLDELEKHYAAVQLEWHTLHTRKVLERTRDLLELSRPIREEADKHAEILARPPP